METEPMSARAAVARGVGGPRALGLALALVVGGVGGGIVAGLLARDAGSAVVAAQAESTPATGVAPGGAGGCFTDSSGEQADLWVRSELFFGAPGPEGTKESEVKWDAFVDTEVTPRFPDGLTVLSGYGQWRGSSGEISQQSSKVLIILYPAEGAQESSAKLEEIRDAYEQQFQQESVLRAEDSALVCTSF